MSGGRRSLSNLNARSAYLIIVDRDPMKLQNLRKLRIAISKAVERALSMSASETPDMYICQACRAGLASWSAGSLDFASASTPS
jgi:hypothetical protein